MLVVVLLPPTSRRRTDRFPPLLILSGALAEAARPLYAWPPLAKTFQTCLLLADSPPISSRRRTDRLPPLLTLSAALAEPARIS